MLCPQLRATYSRQHKAPGRSVTPAGWGSTPTPDHQAVGRLARERLVGLETKAVEANEAVGRLAQERLAALETQAPGSRITDDLLQIS